MPVSLDSDDTFLLDCVANRFLGVSFHCNVFLTVSAPPPLDTASPPVVLLACSCPCSCLFFSFGSSWCFAEHISHASSLRGGWPL